MKNVLKDKANIPFRIPDNIELIKIDRTTGKRPTLISKQKDMIFETFVKGTAPKNENEELKELIEHNDEENNSENIKEENYNNVMQLLDGVF
jgi:membrane carboxypeptidase/penicillin-binding protein